MVLLWALPRWGMHDTQEELWFLEGVRWAWGGMSSSALGWLGARGSEDSGNLEDFRIWTRLGR